MAQNVTFNMNAIATLRDQVGNAMEQLGKEHPKMVVVTEDVDTSSRVVGCKTAFPERCFNVGIAEQNLISFAAGLAHEGYIPFAFTFAPFASMRACEQVRTDVCYGNLPIRIIGNGVGYSNGISGCTHCALEDVAIMSSFPNMTIIEPGDPFQVVKVLEETMKWDGPIYIRMGRQATHSLYDENVAYKIGKALIPREGSDGAFIGSGVTVHFAMEAAERIYQETGAQIRVVDMHTLKPLDKEAVLAAASTGRVVVAQDHNIIGGLGYLCAAVLMENGVNCKYKILGCPDKFVPIANPDFLYHLNEYDVDGLYKHMMSLLK